MTVYFKAANPPKNATPDIVTTRNLCDLMICMNQRIDLLTQELRYSLGNLENYLGWTDEQILTPEELALKRSESMNGRIASLKEQLAESFSKIQEFIGLIEGDVDD